MKSILDSADELLGYMFPDVLKAIIENLEIHLDEADFPEPQAIDFQKRAQDMLMNITGEHVKSKYQ